MHHLHAEGGGHGAEQKQAEQRLLHEAQLQAVKRNGAAQGEQRRKKRGRVGHGVSGA